MPKFPVLNFSRWIEENRHLLKPPVGNKVVYEGADDFIVMVVGGPNKRTDYHYNETEEFFYMLEGEMMLKIQDEGKQVDIPIREGEIFLLPPRVPHSPRRPAGSMGLVIECKRNASHTDGLLWFCPQCNNKLHEVYFPMENIETQMQSVFKAFYENETARTCKVCRAVHPVPA